MNPIANTISNVTPNATNNTAQSTGYNEDSCYLANKNLVPANFHTKIFRRENNQEVPFSVELTYKTRETYPIYELKTTNENVLGEIDLAADENHYLYINYMRSNDSDNYHNIGRALHEFAMRECFQKGLKGIKLTADFNSDVFHFKCGYLYDQPYSTSYGAAVPEEFWDLVSDYFRAADKDQPTDKILKDIEDLRKNYDEEIKSLKEQISKDQNNSKLLKKFDEVEDDRKSTFGVIEKVARIELKREPKDMREMLDYGARLNYNVILDRVFNHPEEKRKAGYYNITKLNRGGNMFLSEAKRLEWQRIFENSK